MTLGAAKGLLGCGTWVAYLQERGGGDKLLEVPLPSFSMTKRLDDSVRGEITLPISGQWREACCAVLETAEPWRHEVVVYRDGAEALVGPVVAVEISKEGGRITVQDLFFWTERRFYSEDVFVSADASVAFETLFLAAMDPDPSPNIDIITHPAGVEVVRRIAGKEFTRSADVLRELARTAVDFTTIGRQVIVGGKEVFEPGIGPGVPLVVHDEAVEQMTVNKDGLQFATDVAVFGEAVSTSSAQRIFGRATRSKELYGLVQQSFAELDIRDTPSANENALSRLLQMQPAPVRVGITFTPQAAFGLSDLICGRRMDMRVSSSAGCIEVMETMRLSEVSVNVSDGGVSETVSATIVPLGLGD